MNPEIVTGNLLNQPVEVIVNSWNRNIIPWWLLIPQGVSGAIKKYGGYRPFLEVGRVGFMPLGSATLTTAGRLPFIGIIHVAGINGLWRATEESIYRSVGAALKIIDDNKFKSVALPAIGAGAGGYSEADSISIMTTALSQITTNARVILVRYDKSAFTRGQ